MGRGIYIDGCRFTFLLVFMVGLLKQVSVLAKALWSGYIFSITLH